MVGTRCRGGKEEMLVLKVLVLLKILNCLGCFSFFAAGLDCLFKRPILRK